MRTAARWPYYGGVCFPGGGGLVPGEVVCLVRGGSAPGGGVSGPGGGIPACTEAEPPPLWTESQTPVKTLPWPNFVAAGKYVIFQGEHPLGEKKIPSPWSICFWWTSQPNRGVWTVRLKCADRKLTYLSPRQNKIIHVACCTIIRSGADLERN